ncbi:glycosyltransferase family 2 protein [Planctomonas psychrotolerans]|uniref:glycosyltransferase family 2 protein n=1 Tax=Planctomonas psychrotolerans TaxID=2528712 RepID=UPI001D0CF132|nr:glycosyltransferase [Planctomonas psychrotolerans]
MSAGAPGRVSVVIPTVGRESLSRALESVLAQTLPVAEILVGSDAGAPLDVPSDPRIRVTQVGPGAGGNRCRRDGMERATGDVIALLDDDDEWDADFLATVLAAVPADAGPTWVASSSGRLSDGSTYPRRLIAPGEDLVSYLFTLKGGPAGKGALSTSTLVFPTALVRRVPWRSDQRFHQDLTWFLDLAASVPELRILQADRALVTFGDTVGSVSKSIRVAESIDWARRELLVSGMPGGRRAFADFLLSRYPLRAAVTARRWRQVADILRVAVRRGRPTVWSLLYAGGFVARGLLHR